MSDSLHKPPAADVSGITFRSVGAALLGLVLQACMIQVAGGIMGSDRLFGSEAIAMPALMIGIGFIGLSALGYLFGRAGLFTRAELICVFYMLLLAAPLMAHGFWRPMISIVSAVPRSQSWGEYDALNPRAWPKGENLLAGAFDAERLKMSVVEGEVSAANATLKAGGDARPAVRLRNEGTADASSVKFFLPLGPEGISAGLPYILTVLARADELAPTAWYYSRIYYDDHELPELEPFVSRQPAQKTVTQPEGFVRLGNYGFGMPLDLESGITIELGLRGQGEVVFTEPLLADVGAIESAFSGKRIIDKAEYEKIPEHLRAGLIVRPDRILSLDGLRFVTIGFIPLKDWLMPFFVWSSIIALLLLGTFALVVIMRRQWIQNERFPMPMAEIPLGLLSINRENSIWRDRMFLTGLIVTLIWSGFRGWNAFNPAVPSLEINVSLKSYLPDASWGGTWDQVSFRILPLALGIGLLMELNVLISLVIGYLLFRMQYWFGESTGLSVDRNFPHAHMQIFGSFGGYALAILFFTRKYLKEVVRLALAGGNPSNEMVSYRTAMLLLVLSIAGAAVWGIWMGVQPVGMVFFFLYLLAFSIVMALRNVFCYWVHIFNPIDIDLSDDGHRGGRHRRSSLRHVGGSGFYEPAGVAAGDGGAGASPPHQARTYNGGRLFGDRRRFFDRWLELPLGGIQRESGRILSHRRIPAEAQ